MSMGALLVAMAAAMAAADRPYVVRHALGETRLVGVPSRVVVLTNEGTEAVLALGVTPVGAVKSWVPGRFYDHLTGRMDGVVLVGDEYEPDLAAIAQLAPDLILGNTLRQEKLYPALSALAPTVFSETLRGRWKANLTLYAQALARTTVADRVLAEWRRKVAATRLGLRPYLGSRVGVVRFMADRVRVYHDDTFSGSILREVGFARAVEAGKDKFFEDLTLDALPEMDPDIVFHFTYEAGDGRATWRAREWTSSATWRRLRAVRSARAFEVREDIWNTAGGVLAADLMLQDLQRKLGESGAPP